MKSILASAVERKAQKPDVLGEKPKLRMCQVSLKNPPHEQGLQDSEHPEFLPERTKECRSKTGVVSSLLTYLLWCSAGRQRWAVDRSS